MGLVQTRKEGGVWKTTVVDICFIRDMRVDKIFSDYILRLTLV